MRKQLQTFVADEVVKELILFSDSLAALDAIVEKLIDVMAAIRDEREVTDEMVLPIEGFSEALQKFDPARARASFERAVALVADKFGL